jgi:hypothetical protein
MRIFALIAISAAGCTSQNKPIPLADGQYVFQHRFAEQPTIPSINLNVTIDGDKIILINPTASDPFPAGVIEQGQLMWHAASKSWIIGHADSDKTAPEVGGCSDGPEVVDLSAKVYWTC